MFIKKLFAKPSKLFTVNFLFRRNIPLHKNYFIPAYLLIIPVLAMLIAACSDSPTDTGSGLLQGDNINVTQLNSLTDTIPQRYSQIKRTVSLYSSQGLYVGNANGAEASVLVDFFISLPDTFKSAIKDNQINILSSKLNLVKLYAIGDTTNYKNLRFSAFKVTSPWSSLFNTDSLGKLNYDQTNLASNLTIGDSLTSFDLDKAFTLSLMQDTASSYYTGLYLKPDPGQNTAIGYQAMNGYSSFSQIPELVIIYEKPGAYQDTILFVPEADLSLIKGDIPAANNEYTYVQSGVVVNTRLWFDLSRIPPNSVINNAELILTTDTTKTTRGTVFQNFLRAYALLDTVKLDSITSSYAKLAGLKGILSGNVTSLVQYQYQTVNHGFLITTGAESEGLDLYAIRSSTAAGTAMRPQLKIIYTNKK